MHAPNFGGLSIKFTHNTLFNVIHVTAVEVLTQTIDEYNAIVVSQLLFNDKGDNS